ncbi:MAG: ribosome biogenesis GTPase Der [Holosporales bacterium]|jgi:GTP-binding protein|nr:ribosome biogenesis GTPase Der [Holosporales bacterium]
MFKVAIIGKTNVGKSTLFNRLSRSRQALTFDRHGVTRDLKETIVDVYNKKCILVDTPGLFEENNLLFEVIQDKILETISQADVIIFVIDAEFGLTEGNRAAAKIIRQSDKKSNVIVAVNKSDKKSQKFSFIDAFSLGFPHTIPISAEHGDNISELIDTLCDILPVNEVFEDKNTREKQEEVIKLAIIGRPNVGKSSIVNRILGKDIRVVVDIPGATRESAGFDFEFNHRYIKIVDTPGLRRKSRIQDTLEVISTIDSRKSYKNADSVILVIDATSLRDGKIEKQDITLAREIINSGKALVIAFNKLDMTPYNRSGEKPEFLKKNIASSLSQLKDVPFLFVCATDGFNIANMLEIALKAYDKQSKKIKTPELNNWLGTINESGILLGKLKYITQIGSAPPKFLIFTNHKVRESHKRYVISSLKEKFDLKEIPVEVIFRENSKHEARR